MREVHVTIALYRQIVKNMSMNYKVLLRISSVIFLILGVGMIPSLLISFALKETIMIKSFVFTIVPLFFLGILMFRFIKPDNPNIKVREGMFIVGSLWIIASAISAIPFVISGTIPNFFDAFFETSSGFTTTGASILTEVESLPKGALFWRSSTQWLGGMGILMFAIAIMPALGINGQHIANAETTGPTKGKITPKMSDSAKILYLIYIGLTLIMVVFLCLGGVSIYDAFLHTFGAVSTAGFSCYNDSIAHYNSFYVEMVIAVGVVMCGINFNIFYQLISAKFKEAGKDSELRFYLIIVAISTFLLTLYLRFNGIYSNIIDSFRYSFFQVASILTTTGFSTTDFSLWPPFCMLLLLSLMFFGACSSSTTGSIKCVRILVMLKLIKKNIYARLHPRAVIPVRLNGKPLSQDIIVGICSFVFLYILMILLGVFVLTFQGIDLITALSASAATLGNVGPGFGDVGPALNYSFFNSGTKFFFSLYMIMGRLEIYTLLVILTPSFWHPEG